MRNISVKIERTNGVVEVVDATEKLGGFISQKIFDIMKKQIKDAGRGTVLEATYTMTKSNISELIKNYNNINNEGKDGYVPDEDYFKNLTEYKEWVVTDTIK